MTYRELVEKLVTTLADEKGYIKGAMASLVFRISQLGEKKGYDCTVDSEAIKHLESWNFDNLFRM